MGPVTLGQERLAANLWSSTRGIRSYIHNWEHDEANFKVLLQTNWFPLPSFYLFVFIRPSLIFWPILNKVYEAWHSNKLRLTSNKQDKSM
jgi:hypothetical protein